MTDSDPKLTGRQERFCREYVKDLNATQAALRAGYSKKSAHSIGSDNLKKPAVARFIQSLQFDLANRLQINAQTVVEALAAIGLCNPDDYKDRSGNLKPFGILSRDEAAAVHAFQGADGETLYKLPSHAERRAALVDVGRHLGIFEKDNEQAGKAAAVAIEAGANIETARTLAYALKIADRERQRQTGEKAPDKDPAPH